MKLLLAICCCIVVTVLRRRGGQIGDLDWRSERYGVGVGTLMVVPELVCAIVDVERCRFADSRASSRCRLNLRTLNSMGRKRCRLWGV